MKSKKIIAVDLDDVLALSAQGFVEFSNGRWGTNLKPGDYGEDWAKMWQIDSAESDRRAQKVYQSGTVKTFKRYPDAEDALRKLAKNYKLVIVTSRHQKTSSETLDWIERHYKGVFNAVHFAGIYDGSSRELHSKLLATKAQLCLEIGADYLIDDHPKHCVGAAEVGLKSLLFGDYPWNQSDKLPLGVTRVKNWQEVLEYFNEQG